MLARYTGVISIPLETYHANFPSQFFCSYIRTTGLKKFTEVSSESPGWRVLRL